MKGRIFQYAKYKAWSEGMITSRVNPRNTSRECARCHAPIIRYRGGQPEEGYTPGAPLMLCRECGLRGHADRNASGCIGQRLIARYQQKPAQEKPRAPRPCAEKESFDSLSALGREGVERLRCCSLPRRRKHRKAIYRLCRAWSKQPAWHRPRDGSRDGDDRLTYPSPTTAVKGE